MLSKIVFVQHYMILELITVCVNLNARILKLQEDMIKIGKQVGFSHCIDSTLKRRNNTKYGNFLVGSSLTHQELIIKH